MMIKKIKNKYKTSLVFVSFFLVQGCDQFSRFNYESFDCGYNSTDIQEVLLSKISKGENLKITSGETVEQTTIVDVNRDFVYFNFNNNRIKINRKDGSLTIKDGNKVTIIECKVSKFKM